MRLCNLSTTLTNMFIKRIGLLLMIKTLQRKKYIYFVRTQIQEVMRTKK